MELRSESLAVSIRRCQDENTSNKMYGLSKSFIFPFSLQYSELLFVTL